VRIDQSKFLEVVNKFGNLREKLMDEAIRLLEGDAKARAQVHNSVEEFLHQGLAGAQKLLVLDLDSCTRCDECTIACSDTHDGITRLIREGLRFENYLIASACRSCLDPYCMIGCPVDAIHRKGDSQEMQIQIDNHCIGCGLCASNCPYGNINMHPEPERSLFGTKNKVTQRDDPQRPGFMLDVLQQKATTCDLCNKVAGGQPSCVYACPHEAAHRITGEELLAISRGERPRPQ
jgi:Fe-S-cluster-containing hydrogenase component 2